MKPFFLILILFSLTSCKSSVKEQIKKDLTPTPSTTPTPTPDIISERAASALYHDEYGGGGAADPYLLYNGTQLVDLSTECSASVFDACDSSYKLETDIDMSGEVFHPIGGISSSFTAPNGTYSGLFDGNSKKISNLTINEGTNFFVAMFSITSGTITNLTLDNVQVYGNKIVSALAGENAGEINNSQATNVKISGLKYLGGLVGFNDTMIINSFTTGSVGGIQWVGGLSSFNSGTILDSYSTATVYGSQSDIGGLVSSNEISGGIEAVIDSCYATGPVIGNNTTGGLVGRQWDATISNSYALGTVSGATFVGGLVGRNIDSSNIYNSYSTGLVSGLDIVGGFAGYTHALGNVVNSYSTGTLTSCSVTCEGFIGSNSATNINNFSLQTDGHPSITQLGDISDIYNIAHTVYTTAGGTEWDFVNTWVDGTTTYPTLK